jgi:hypothetical protein
VEEERLIVADKEVAEFEIDFRDKDRETENIGSNFSSVDQTVSFGCQSDRRVNVAPAIIRLPEHISDVVERAGYNRIVMSRLV